MAEREDLAALQQAMRDLGGDVKIVSAPAPSPASECPDCEEYDAQMVRWAKNPGADPDRVPINHCLKHEASPVCEQDEMERRAREFYANDEADNDSVLGEIDCSNTGTVYKWMAAFATQEVAAERKRVLEAACKAVCRNCEFGVPVVMTEAGIWEHTETKLPWRVCKAAAIRKLGER